MIEKRLEKMNICICDDDKNFIMQMHSLLQELAPKNHLLSFTSGFELLDYIQKPNNQIDILFLDMEMPGLNGLQTAAELRRSHPHMAVVVVTNYPQYAVACYDFLPVHYVLKPISAERIQCCLDRAKKSSSEDVLLVKTRSGLQYIPLYDIYALESSGLQVSLTLEQQKASVYQTLAYYEKILKSKGFYRVHSGAIINLEYVVEVVGNAVTLTNGQTFYASRRKKKDFMTALLKWRKAYA